MNKGAIHDWLPERIEVTDEIIEDYQERGLLSKLCLQLYREAGSVCVLCASADIEGKGSEWVFDRKQAICAGLLIRIAKFMVAVLRLSEGQEHGEVIMAINRSITESATNLRFLISKNDDELFERYVTASLSTEREFYDLVMRQIDQRGETLVIDERILKSIHRLASLSGVDIEEVDPKFHDWAGGLRQRYEALGQPDRYVTEERMGSHAVHGTWVDLVQNHLRPVNGGFVIDYDPTESDGQLQWGGALVALEAAQAYLMEFFKDVPDSQILFNRIEDLMERTLAVGTADDDWSAGGH